MKKQISNMKNKKGGKTAFLPILQSDPQDHNRLDHLTQATDAIQTKYHHQRIIKTTLLLLILGFIYFLWLQITRLSIPCFFRTVTGFLCPGCGITTLILSLAELNFQRAFRANPFLFATGPLLLAELLYFFILQWNEKKLPKWNERLVVFYGIALCIFGIYRNL